MENFFICGNKKERVCMYLVHRLKSVIGITNRLAKGRFKIVQQRYNES